MIHDIGTTEWEPESNQNLSNGVEKTYCLTQTYEEAACVVVYDGHIVQRSTDGHIVVICHDHKEDNL